MRGVILINMNRSIFQIYKQKPVLTFKFFFSIMFQIIFINIFFMCILYIIIKTFSIVDCKPLGVFMEKDSINRRTYFYHGEVVKTLVESDLKILLENFNNVNFELVKYLDINGYRFNRRHPNDHFNLILNSQNVMLNYHYSFSFTHLNVKVIPKYYEYLYNQDWLSNPRIQL
jgi:hypothetical protein